MWKHGHKDRERKNDRANANNWWIHIKGIRELLVLFLEFFYKTEELQQNKKLQKINKIGQTPIKSLI